MGLFGLRLKAEIIPPNGPMGSTKTSLMILSLATGRAGDRFWDVEKKTSQHAKDRSL
jgi:hypothetical protein